MTDRKLIAATVLIMALMVVLIGGPIWLWGPLGAAIFCGVLLVGVIGGIIYQILKDTYGNKKDRDQ